MKFVKYDGEVKRANACKYKKMQVHLKEFMSSNIKTAEVIWDERDYKHIKSAYNNIRKAIERGVFPIDIVKNGEHLYLVRRDM